MGKTLLMMNINLLHRIRHLIYSPTKWARYLGVKVGDNCLIGKDHWSSEPYLITIGHHVQLTSGVRIHTHGGGNSVRMFDPSFDCFGKVKIDDWAYIGSGSHIMPGVTIGEGALVAAGSVVTKTVEPRTVVGGNPAHYICTTQEYFEKNKHYNIKTKGLSVKEKKRILLSLPDTAFITK